MNFFRISEHMQKQNKIFRKDYLKLKMLFYAINNLGGVTRNGEGFYPVLYEVWNSENIDINSQSWKTAFVPGAHLIH